MWNPMGEAAQFRVGIAGTGFIGAVHARSALLAGGRLVGVAASSPASAEDAATRLRAERAFESAEALVEQMDRDVVETRRIAA
jgi:predicted dehydrogenase